MRIAITSDSHLGHTSPTIAFQNDMDERFSSVNIGYVPGDVRYITPNTYLMVMEIQIFIKN
jgi:hypothetical protein